MTAQQTRTDITVENGIIHGPLRTSRNMSRDAKGSIHDDATATKLGFRGGTVAGSIHMELFPPLLLEAFGQRWFERGRSPCTSSTPRPTRTGARLHGQPAAGSQRAQVEVWIEREDGMRVAEGTAAVGTPCSHRAASPPARPLRAGRAAHPQRHRTRAPVRARDRLGRTQRQQERMAVITEPLDWYIGDSPWGGPIAMPTTTVQAL